MKKNKWLYRVVSGGLLIMLLLQIAGCTPKTEVVKIEPMRIEDVHNYSFDFIGGTDVMPIVGFFGPTVSQYSYNGNNLPDYYSDEMFELYAGTGINTIGNNSTDYALYPEYIEKLLLQGEKYGIGITVTDSRLTGSEAKKMTLQQVDECINDYSNYAAYCGNYIIDEPSYQEYFAGTLNGHSVEDFQSIFENINNLGFHGYGNLLPIGMGSDEGYAKYAKDFMEICNPPYLSYDMYPFNEGNGLDQAVKYFKNITYIREAAEEAEVPFWVFVQCGSQWNDAQIKFDSDGYYPKKGEFLWNVNTYLAFGAKGIQYFTLIQPHWFAYAESTPLDCQRNGMVGALGNKTRWYYYAQEANAQIVAVDEVLMNSVNKGVLAIGKEAKEDVADSSFLLEGSSWRELTDVTGDALIGCFNYQGKTALYVVNYDVDYAQKIALDFADTYDITVIQDAKESHLSRNSLELSLTAGNSALIVFE